MSEGAMEKQFALTEESLARMVERVSEEIAKADRTQRRLAELREMMLMNEIPKGDVLRVEINEDGTFNILDFGLVTEGTRRQTNVPQEEVPQWIMEAVSMLRIAEEGDLIPELGFRVSDLLYYVVPQTGESNV